MTVAALLSALGEKDLRSPRSPVVSAMDGVGSAVRLPGPVPGLTVLGFLLLLAVISALPAPSEREAKGGFVAAYTHNLKILALVLGSVVVLASIGDPGFPLFVLRNIFR